VVETKDALIGIESKRYEPFRDKKRVRFSKAYARNVWGSNMVQFQSMCASLEGGVPPYVFVDAAQLVKHAFAIRTQAQKRNKSASLLYLYAEPTVYPSGTPIPTDEIMSHRSEVARFAAAVGGAQVSFAALTYAELLETWRASQYARLRDHARAFLARFDVDSLGGMPCAAA
jgi:hypothetical protein